MSGAEVPTRAVLLSLLTLLLTGCLYGRTDSATRAAACEPDAAMYDAVSTDPVLLAPLGGVQPELGGVPPDFDEKTGQCGTTVAVVRWKADPARAPALVADLAARLRQTGWAEVGRGFGAVELSRVRSGEEVALLLAYDAERRVVEARGKRAAAG